MSDRTSAYAAAVVEIARAEGGLDTVQDELAQLARAIDDSPELRDALSDTSRPVGQRLAVLEAETLGAASTGTLAALAMIVAGGAASELGEVATDVARVAARDRGRELAEVRVAVELSEERRESLREALEQATGKDLDLQVVVDPSVVGGVRAIVGDTVIDGSVAHRLDTVRTRVGT